MKPYPSISRARACAGILLVECLVYLGVFAVLIGIGYGTFYMCWDYSKALCYATDDIASALRAGERWRADCDEPLMEGDTVRVLGMENMRLKVEKIGGQS